MNGTYGRLPSSGSHAHLSLQIFARLFTFIWRILTFLGSNGSTRVKLMVNSPSSAIYAIISLTDQSRYVGSTARLDKRPDEHWRALSTGRHFNRGLQAAYRKHGANNFAFVVLEWIDDPATLADRESQFLANAMRAGHAFNTSTATKVSRGHKLSAETRQRQSRARTGKKRPGFGAKIAPLVSKDYCFISPTGEVVETRGLRGLCDQHKLNVGNMSSVARGRLNQHKGWTRG